MICLQTSSATRVMKIPYGSVLHCKWRLQSARSMTPRSLKPSAGSSFVTEYFMSLKTTVLTVWLCMAGLSVRPGETLLTSRWVNAGKFCCCMTLLSYLLSVKWRKYQYAKLINECLANFFYCSYPSKMLSECWSHAAEAATGDTCNDNNGNGCRKQQAQAYMICSRVNFPSHTFQISRSWYCNDKIDRKFAECYFLLFFCVRCHCDRYKCI